MPTQIIHNKEHYDKVIKKVADCKRTLWIGTADIKDLHVKELGGHTASFLKILEQLVRKGVDIRLIYAKQPGPNFQSSLSKYPLVKKNVEMLLCPRTHFKMIIMDFDYAYFGSANLTGAGLGLKSENRRNFETGMVSDHPEIIDSLTKQFDELWMGKHCKDCGRKEYCPAPIK